MTRTDFIWSIGFQGNTAVVNKRMKASVRDLSWKALLEQGLLRPALCAAIWDSEMESKKDSLSDFITQLSTRTGKPMSLEEVKRMLGVYQVPDEKVKVLSV